MQQHHYALIISIDYFGSSGTYYNRNWNTIARLRHAFIEKMGILPQNVHVLADGPDNETATWGNRNFPTADNIYLYICDFYNRMCNGIVPNADIRIWIYISGDTVAVPTPFRNTPSPNGISTALIASDHQLVYDVELRMWLRSLVSKARLPYTVECWVLMDIPEGDGFTSEEFHTLEIGIAPSLIQSNTVFYNTAALPLPVYTPHTNSADAIRPQLGEVFPINGQYVMLTPYARFLGDFDDGIASRFGGLPILRDENNQRITPFAYYFTRAFESVGPPPLRSFWEDLQSWRALGESQLTGRGYWTGSWIDLINRLLWHTRINRTTRRNWAFVLGSCGALDASLATYCRPTGPRIRAATGYEWMLLQAIALYRRFRTWLAI